MKTNSANIIFAKSHRPLTNSNFAENLIWWFEYPIQFEWNMIKKSNLKTGVFFIPILLDSREENQNGKY